MDKFTKTTEIDISAMTEMEDETPQKSNAGKIIAMIICLIFAIIIWLFVMEIDTSDREREYKNISILRVNDDGYTVTGDESVDVILTGLNHELADIDRNEIRAILHFSPEKIVLGKEHEYAVEIELPDDAGESVRSTVTTVKLTINKAS